MNITITPCHRGRLVNHSFPVSLSELDKLKSHFLILPDANKVVLPLQAWKFIGSLKNEHIVYVDSFILSI